MSDSMIYARPGLGGDTITVDEVEYIAPFRIVSITSSHDRWEVEFDRLDFTDECDHCHRFSAKPTVARSWQEAIDRGLLVRTGPTEPLKP